MLFKGLVAIASVIEMISLLTGWIAGVLVCGVALAYLGSLLWRPNRRCISCKGAGKHGDKNLRRCWTCGGRKEYPRWGTLILRPEISREIRAGRHNRNY